MSNNTFYKWSELAELQPFPGITLRLVSGDKVMLVEYTIVAGAVVPMHQHPHEQITHVLSGSLEFEVEGEKRTIATGDVLVIPGDVPHGGVALEPSMTLEAFAPPREDFLAKLEG